MNNNFRQFAIAYSLILKFGAMMACPVFAGLATGVYLDKQFGTTPWGIFILTISGMIFSTYAVYRVVMRTQNKNIDKGE